MRRAVLSPARMLFLGRRILLAFATLWVLSVVTFVLGALAPGSPVERMLEQHADAATVQQTKHLYGLDQPLPVRYARWLGGFLRGDLGLSYRYQDRPVGEMLAR